MKSTQLWIILVSVVMGAALCFGVVSIHSNKQVERLKHYSDSVAVVAAQNDSIARKFSDSVKVAVAELEKTKRALVNVTVANRRIDVKLDSALALALTTADSNNIRGQQVENLRQENVTLRGALAIANNQLSIETFRGDSLLRSLNNANQTILTLNNKIQHLGPSVPGWVRTGAKIVVITGAFYAGTQVGKNSK